MKKKPRKRHHQDKEDLHVLEQLKSLDELQGFSDWLNYLERDEPLPLKEAIIAKCCECRMESDGPGIDCDDPVCPLHPYCPYRESKKHDKSRRDRMMESLVLLAFMSIRHKEQMQGH